MGQTLQELLEEDFGAGSEKIASQSENVNQGADGGNDGLDKLASELGLFDDGAAAPANTNTDGDPAQNADGSEKVASDDALSGLYNEMFPDDLDMAGTEKTAEQQKVAQAEEILGSMAYDAFADRFDQRVEKLAKDVMSGNATVDAPEASINGGNPHGDSRPDQTQPQNRPADAASAINTTPQVDNQLPPQKGDHVTGSEQPGAQATEKAAAARAFRKAMLLSQISA